MKTALQALEQTINKLTSNSKEELIKVSSKIDEAIKEGRFYIFEAGELNSYTVYELEKQGYYVTHNCTNLKWYYFISWFACDVYRDDYLGRCKKEHNNTTDNSRKKRKKYYFPIFRR